ncbi:MAG TPA: tyrosine-protein phosphatase [Solirubrobacteraceae bacterium]|nr:tyrosine-protein phosphatase [Solirubrobacteraceae bacterium]
MTIENEMTRWLALEGAANARVVVPGVLLRSDNLQSLTDQDIALLVEREAVEVVLDLRTDVEVALEGPGPLTRDPRVRIEHRSLYPQTNGNTDLDAATVKPWRESAPGRFSEEEESPVVRAYLSYLVARPDSIVASIRAIARAGGAALVHCAAGKDRTGVVVALALDAGGVGRGMIVTDYLATAERIDAILGRLLGSPTYRAELEGQDPQRHAPAPGTMERVLDLVDEHFGGSAAWLAAHGLGEADLDRLQRRLAESPRR